MFKVYWNLEDVPAAPAPAALAIGNFDGLHRGHLEILNRTKREARRIGGEAIRVDFRSPSDESGRAGSGSRTVDERGRAHAAL